MAQVTEKDIMHLAHLARLQVSQAEAQAFAQQVDAVLSYASSLAEIAKTIPADLDVQLPHENVMREDVVESFDAASLLALAPEREEDFYVVPRILSRT